jgi:anti-sigma B factor antagonist
MTQDTKAQIEKNGSVAIVRFQGDITSASKAAVVDSYQSLDKGAYKQIMLDFSKVEYLNSSGIALVIQVLMEASKAGQTVECFGLSAHFQKVFTMLGLTKYTRLHANEDAARAAIV